MFNILSKGIFPSTANSFGSFASNFELAPPTYSQLSSIRSSELLWGRRVTSFVFSSLGGLEATALDVVVVEGTLISSSLILLCFGTLGKLSARLWVSENYKVGEVGGWKKNIQNSKGSMAKESLKGSSMSPKSMSSSPSIPLPIPIPISSESEEESLTKVNSALSPVEA